MYVDPLHRSSDRAATFAPMAPHPLGAWVCHGHEGVVANPPMPFLLERKRGALGTLIGHVARANTVWREPGPAAPSVVSFQDPQAYVTPGWYPRQGGAQRGRSHLEPRGGPCAGQCEGDRGP
jgi:transcriptional regulator